MDTDLAALPGAAMGELRASECGAVKVTVHDVGDWALVEALEQHSDWVRATCDEELLDGLRRAVDAELKALKALDVLEQKFAALKAAATAVVEHSDDFRAEAVDALRDVLGAL